MAKKLKPQINPPLEILSPQPGKHLPMPFWVGGTLTIGIVDIPLLFKTLDQINAATITGQILNINAYIGIVALLLALIELGVHLKLNLLQSRKFWYALVMETVLIVNYFAIFPIIVELRTKLTDVTNRIIQHSSEFSFWHSISSILFLLTCILGALYMLERK